MHVVAAPDKFRGTATAPEISAAIALAVAAIGGTCDQAPVSDGGEGFVDVMGGSNRTTTVTGPLGDPVEAGWRLTKAGAVIEMAAASGLDLVCGPEQNDPLAASTFGSGELILEAIEAGARRVVVGVGGSATTDGGLGALRALYPVHRLRGVELVVACDVKTRFVDAARVFGAQKGATSAQIDLLQRRLERLVQVYRDDYGANIAGIEGSGAGGGFAGGLAAVGGDLLPGFDVVADEIDLYGRMRGADLVVTGEGFVDEESFDGKVVGGVVELAAEVGTSVLIVAGDVAVNVAADFGADGISSDFPRCMGIKAPRRVEMVSLTGRFGRRRAMTDTIACVTEIVAERLRASDVL